MQEFDKLKQHNKLACRYLSIAYYASSIIIAVIAIISLYFSISSSNDMSKRMEKIFSTILDVTIPTIAFDGITIFENVDEHAQGPLHGIEISIRNKSISPIKIMSFEYTIQLNVEEESDYNAYSKIDINSIVPSGNDLNYEIKGIEFGDQKNQYQSKAEINNNYIFQNNIVSIFVHISIDYSTLHTNRIFRYTTKRKFDYDLISKEISPLILDEDITELCN